MKARFPNTYLFLSLVLQPCMQRFSVPPEEGGEHTESSVLCFARCLMPVTVILSSLVHRVIFCCSTICVYYMLFLFIVCQLSSLVFFSFLPVVSIVPDSQGFSSCPLWSVFTVGDLWRQPVLVHFRTPIYSQIYFTEHSYWLLLLTINVNHTIAQN